jgi:6-phosphogluconolactonase
MIHKTRIPILALLLAAACTDGATPPTTDTTGDAQLTVAERAAFREDRVGSVFVLSNDTAANAVLAFPRSRDGRLGESTSYVTGGRGTGRGLGNQDGLIMDDDHQMLYGVDAGSDEISAFEINGGALRFAQRVSSNGNTPISIAMHDDLLYVLNDGANSNITGFRVARNGRLVPLPGSTRARSAPAGSIDGAQISFAPDGNTLIVTEKAANVIVAYPVLRNGRTGEPRVIPSSGATPFGFDFTRSGTLIVSEAFGGAAGASAVSSYTVDRASRVSLISGSVPNGEAAVCWIVTTRDGAFAFASNTGSNTVNAYAVRRNGSLSVVAGSLVSTGAGSGPVDMALSRRDKYLYVRNGGGRSISIYMPEADGTLTALGTTTGLPAGANGIVAR